MKLPHLKLSVFLLLLLGITGASVWFASQDSGTLEAYKGFVVAPKVSGRIEQLSVDLADSVVRGQLVAELDNVEYRQAVAQANAELEATRIRLDLDDLGADPCGLLTVSLGTRSDTNMNVHLLFKVLTNPKYSYKVSDYVRTV